MLNNLYEILNIGENSLTIKLAQTTHEVFLAHFPNNPLLPGFMLIDICEKEFKFKLKKLKKVSFLNPILPQDIVKFKLSKLTKSLQMDISVDKKAVALIVFEIF